MNDNLTTTPTSPTKEPWICETCKHHLGNYRCALQKLIFVGDGPLRRCSGYEQRAK